LFLAGSTSSHDLPTLLGAQANLKAGSDGFLCSFDPRGMSLQSSSYFGGTGNDAIVGAVSSSNNVWTLFGTTTSRDIPGEGGGTTGDVFGANDLFIARGAISGITYYTTIGWAGIETATALIEDKRADIYIAGTSDARTISWSGGSVTNAGPAGTTEGFVSKWALGTLDLVTPRGGERVCAGQDLGVTWATVDLSATEEFELEISSDGITWTSAASKLKNRSLAWKVPTSLSRNNQYLLRIISAHGHISRATGTFTLREPAAIVSSPSNQHVCVGDTVVLRVSATGEALTYAWKRNGTNVANATGTQLTLANITSAKSGSYEAIVTSACGFVVSVPAQVKVDVDVAITEQPADKTLVEGQMLILSVRAEGLGIVYTWLHNGQVVTGATGANLRIPYAAMTDAGEYSVVLTGKCGTDTSRVASVIVNSKPVSVLSDISAHFGIAPNPASAVLDVTISEPAMLTITDMHAQTMLTFNARELAAYPAKLHLNLEPLASGRYVVSDGKSARLLTIVR